VATPVALVLVSAGQSSTRSGGGVMVGGAGVAQGDPLDTRADIAAIVCGRPGALYNRHGDARDWERRRWRRRPGLRLV